MSVLIGRDSELAKVERFLVDEVLTTRLLLIEGAPGIGKTAFLAEVTRLAGRRRYRILQSNPVEAEADLSFAGLGDLLRRVDIGGIDVLPEPQRIALEIALLLRSPDAVQPHPRAVGTGLLSILRDLAAQAPVLLVVDDAQWLDQPSAAALRFAVRRLEGSSVAMIISRRTETAGEVDDWVGGEERTTLALGPLAMGAVHALLSERLRMTLKRSELHRIHQWSRGNPLHALELARAYAEGSVRFDDAVAVPIGLENLLMSRIERLSSETRKGLAAVAASSSLTVDQLSQIMDRTEAANLLGEAVVSGVVEIDQGWVTFTHPLFAAAAYGSVDPIELRGVHRRLAQVTDDPDERARHLAHSIDGRDEAVAEALEKAAENVFRRGAPLVAAGLAQLAGERTPEGNGAARRRRTLAEAEYRFEAGDTLAASGLVTDLIAREDAGPMRAASLSLLARYHHFADGLDGSASYLNSAKDEADDDPRLRFGIEEGLAWNLLLMRSDLRAADRAASDAVTYAEILGDGAAVAEALAVATLTRSALGEEAGDLIERALSLEPHTLQLRVLRHPSFSYGSMLTSLDRFEEAKEVFADLIGRAEAGGDESALPTLLHHLALVECLQGRFPEALKHATEAVSVADQDEQIPARTSALGRLALIHARVGDATAARETADAALGRRDSDGLGPAELSKSMARGGEMAIWARALASLFDGDAAGAANWLLPMAQVFRDAGYQSPGDTRFLPDTVEALVSVGDHEHAAEILGWMETMPVARPAAAAALAMARAMVLAGEADFSGARTHLIEAIDALSRAESPFERGRALLMLGKVLRRSRSKTNARDMLEEAAEQFSRIGAAGWARTARGEAERIGRRPANEFTNAEIRIATLVAEGHSNKEVAQRLFISTKTVEATLTRLYGKIGIRSRTELVRWAIERQAG